VYAAPVAECHHPHRRPTGFADSLVDDFGNRHHADTALIRGFTGDDGSNDTLLVRGCTKPSARQREQQKAVQQAEPLAQCGS